MYLVVTDLDGTLLNHDDYSWSGARHALKALAAREIPVVFCTSKTRAEVEILRSATRNHHPFIVENGGAVFFPEEGFGEALSHLPLRDGYRVDELGTPYRILVHALADAAEESGCRVQGFAGATTQQVAAWCEFSAEEATLAMQREYDEPFLLHSGDPQRLTEAIEARGLHWTQGGRFCHILGDNDKGAAVERLQHAYQALGMHTHIIALGDSPNDFPLLRNAHIAILIPSPHTETMKAALPHAITAPEPGSRGWGAAILKLLETLPE